MGSLVDDMPVLDPVDPGWDVDELLDVEPGELGTGDMLSALQAVSQAESMLRAKRLELMQAYGEAKADTPEAEWVPDELAVVLTISIHRAHGECGLAETLTRSLPRTLAALKVGKLDQHRVRTIVDAVETLSDEHRALLEERIYPAAVDKTPRQLADLVRREVLALDPDAANKRARAAKADRQVRVRPDDHGMGWLHALLKAEDVHAVYQRVDQLAHALHRTDDARSIDQLRADVLRDLLLGDLDAGGVVTHIYATATVSTLLGLDDLPGDLRGYGPLPAERVRELAYQLHTVWSGVLVDDNGYPKKLAERRYRFTGKLAEFIRLRDQTCAHPGCHRRAERCDIDHETPWPDGATHADNGIPECRRHHRCKTHTDWRTRRADNGDIHWTHPDGRTHINRAQPLAPSHDPPPF